MILRPTLPPSRRRRARPQGFTLIEMMIVISIIGLMAVAALPKLGSMMSENRLHRVALEVMLAARKARVEAMFSGYASALHFRQEGDNAVIQTVTGGTPRCNRGDGIARNMLDGVPAPPRGYQPLPGTSPIWLANYAFISSIRARLTFNNGNVDEGFLCWEPRGECWYSTDPYAAAGVNPDTVMYFERFDMSGNLVGVARQVVFPDSCTARLR